MTDPRIEKFAKVLTHYSIKLKKGDLVQIQGSALAAPLIKAAYREALLCGAHPYTKVSVEGLSEVFYKNAKEEQLRYVSEIRRMEVEKLDAVLNFGGGWNAKSLTNVDPQKIAVAQSARKELFKRFLERVARGEMRACIAQFPTHSSAREAEMSLSEYEDFVFSACFVDKKDPVAEWKKIEQRQKKIVSFLNRKKLIHIRTKDTDLKVSVAGRKWVNCCGTVNMPDGEIFTSPVENSIEGHIRFTTYPVFYHGREAHNVYLEFKRGKVVKATASKGEDFLISMLDMDKGARRVGEISFGTNYRIKKFTKNTLFDEKIGGTMHLALGASLPKTGGKNVSSLHWDMVLDMKKGEAIADGGVIYRNRKFLI